MNTRLGDTGLSVDENGDVLGLLALMLAVGAALFRGTAFNGDAIREERVISLSFVA